MTDNAQFLEAYGEPTYGDIPNPKSESERLIFDKFMACLCENAVLKLEIKRMNEQQERERVRRAKLVDGLIKAAEEKGRLEGQLKTRP